MKRDIEICREAKKLDIKEIASKLGIEDKIEFYGHGTYGGKILSKSNTNISFIK